MSPACSLTKRFNNTDSTLGASSMSTDATSQARKFFADLGPDIWGQ
jgi:hypothetical protein